MAGLTKTHFISIAEIINSCRLYSIGKYGEENAENRMDLKRFIDKLSEWLKTQNPLFNENQFKKACLK